MRSGPRDVEPRNWRYWISSNWSPPLKRECGSVSRPRLSLAIFDRSTMVATLDNRLRLLNRLLRGWGNFYLHAWGANCVFAALDHHVWWTITRWLHKKHPSAIRVVRHQQGSDPGLNIDGEPGAQQK